MQSDKRGRLCYGATLAPLHSIARVAPGEQDYGLQFGCCSNWCRRFSTLVEDAFREVSRSSFAFEATCGHFPEGWSSLPRTFAQVEWPSYTSND